MVVRTGGIVMIKPFMFVVSLLFAFAAFDYFSTGVEIAAEISSSVNEAL